MLFAVLALLLVQQPANVWVGIGYAAQANGLRVASLPYGSPAEKAGVRIDDVILMSGDAEFRELVSLRKPGEEVILRVLRGDATLEITVIVEERPVGVGAIKEYSGRTFPRSDWPEEQLANALIREFNIGEAHQSLRRQLGRVSDRGDQFRMSRVAYVQDEPFQLRTIAVSTLDEVAEAANRKNPGAILHLAADWLDAGASAAQPLRTGLSLDQHLDQLVQLLRDVRAKQEESFAAITPDARQYLAANAPDVLNIFSQRLDLEGERDPARRQRIQQVLDLASRVNYAAIAEAAALYWRVSHTGYLDSLESAVTKAWEAAGKPEGTFINRDTPFGRILVGGRGNSTYTEDAAILLDLGGKDFYPNNAGSPRHDRIPVGLLIDFSGDDAYEATFNWTQGAAFMGQGLFVDRAGNDEYVGFDWAQGAAALGAALFLDESGNDVYRAIQFAQGAAAWGVAVHMDYAGDDIYESHLLSQAVGMPGGAGWLINGSGNDRYYSKGKNPTGYGDPGIFRQLVAGQRRRISKSAVGRHCAAL